MWETVITVVDAAAVVVVVAAAKAERVGLTQMLSARP